MISYLNFFLLVLCNISICFGDVEIKEFPQASDAKMFLNYSEGMIILPRFSLNELGVIASHENRIFKVPTAKLEKYGLKIGSVVKSVDIKTGIRNPDYVLKDFVLGIQAPGGATDNVLERNKLRIVVSYDDKFIESVKKIKYFNDYATGIAYFGNERKFHTAKEELISTNDISKVDFKLTGWNPKKKGAQIKSVNLFDNELYVYVDPDGSSGYIPVLKTASGYLGFTTSASILTEDLRHLKIAEWGKEEKLLIIGDLFSDYNCSYVYFISKNNSTQVPLPCEERP